MLMYCSMCSTNCNAVNVQQVCSDVLTRAQRVSDNESMAM